MLPSAGSGTWPEATGAEPGGGAAAAGAAVGGAAGIPFGQTAGGPGVGFAQGEGKGREVQAGKAGSDELRMPDGTVPPSV